MTIIEFLKISKNQSVLDGTVSGMYDHIVNTLILMADLGILWVMLKGQTRREKTQNRRRFNRILQSMGLR